MLIERMRKRLAADRANFIKPCLRQLDSRDQARRLPAHGPARPRGLRLITRGGHRLGSRYPLVVEGEPPQGAVLPDRDENGLATYQLLRHRRNEPKAFLYAFDLLELNGTDLRREPLEIRKATLASVLRFQHACKMGLEGIALSDWDRVTDPGVLKIG
jgi:hypothetical protein